MLTDGRDLGDSVFVAHFYVSVYYVVISSVYLLRVNNDLITNAFHCQKCWRQKYLDRLNVFSWFIVSGENIYNNKLLSEKRLINDK